MCYLHSSRGTAHRAAPANTLPRPANPDPRLLQLLRGDVASGPRLLLAPRQRPHLPSVHHHPSTGAGPCPSGAKYWRADCPAAQMRVPEGQDSSPAMRPLQLAPGTAPRKLGLVFGDRSDILAILNAVIDDLQVSCLLPESMKLAADFTGHEGGSVRLLPVAGSTPQT